MMRALIYLFIICFVAAVLFFNKFGPNSRIALAIKLLLIAIGVVAVIDHLLR
jgi:hypothetical protein